MKSIWKNGLIFLLVLSVTGSACLPAGASETLADRFNGDAPAEESSAGEIPTYAEWLAAREQEQYTDAAADIELSAVNYSSAGGVLPEKPEEYAGKTGVLYISEDNSYVEWTVDAPEKGLYELEIEYYTGGGRMPVSRSVFINGEQPYQEASSLNMYRLFAHDGEPRVNSLGDEVRPVDVSVEKWVSARLYDSMGKYSTPLKFALEAGENTLRLEYVDQPVAIASIRLCASEEIRPYSEVLADWKASGCRNASQKITFEAEGPQLTEKNDFSITMYGDGDIYAQPKGVTHTRMNVMGGYTWKNGGQAITWRFEVKESGLYKLALRGAQFWNDGVPSVRRIEIDHTVPFEEFLEYRFPYDRGSYTAALEDAGGDPYLLYLSEGWHELTMTVQLGVIAQVFEEVNDNILLLSEIAHKIVMITGSDPDVNYDYELDKAIPSLMDDLQRLHDGLGRTAEKLLAVSNRRPSVINSFEEIQSQIKAILRNPDNIPRRLDDLNNALTTMGELLNTVIEQPYMVDHFAFLPPDAEVDNPQSNFWDKFIATMQNFFASFFKDYNSIGSFSGDMPVTETLDVWITKGKEWGEILKELTDSSFTSETGIQIRLNIMPSGSIGTGANPLLLSINSGTAPDIGMGIASNQPVEYAIRNALVDLSSMPGFEVVRERFYEDILIPFTYENKVYALPETMNTKVIYYRTDVFEEYGLELPDTWDDVRDTLMPALYQQNMEIYVPQSYDMFLYQNGGQYYTEDGRQSALDTTEAYTAFKELVELYTHLGVPVSANFLNRFRTGEMPVGIDSLGFYMTLSYGAPELKGKWAMAPIPGTWRDGVIDRSTGGMAADADVIISQSDKQEAAWEFLKWWNSTETQTEFAAQVEARIGTSARWLSANKEAFDTLGFSRADKEVINKAFSFTTEQPIVLGGYFTSRHLTNALNRCIVSNQPVRDSMEEMVEQINVELRRRQDSQQKYTQPSRQ